MVKPLIRKEKPQAVAFEVTDPEASRTPTQDGPTGVVLPPAEVPVMTDADRVAALAEYAHNQEVRLQRTLEKRTKRFAAKLASQQESQAQVVARQLRIKQLRTEIQERRDWIKKLRVEIRDLRPKKASSVANAGQDAAAI